MLIEEKRVKICRQEQPALLTHNFGLYLVEQNPMQKKDPLTTQDPYLS